MGLTYTFKFMYHQVHKFENIRSVGVKTTSEDKSSFYGLKAFSLNIDSAFPFTGCSDIFSAVVTG